MAHKAWCGGGRQAGRVARRWCCLGTGEIGRGSAARARSNLPWPILLAAGSGGLGAERSAVTDCGTVVVRKGGACGVQRSVASARAGDDVA